MPKARKDAAKARTRSIKENQDGCYIIGPVSGSNAWTSNASLLGAYLGFTGRVLDWQNFFLGLAGAESKKCRELLDAYLTAEKKYKARRTREKKDGTDNANLMNNYTIKNLYNSLNDVANHQQWLGNTVRLPFTKEHMPPLENRLEAIYMVTIANLIDSCPSMFPDTKKEAAELKYTVRNGRWSVEDVNRAFYLLKLTTYLESNQKKSNFAKWTVKPSEMLPIAEYFTEEDRVAFRMHLTQEEGRELHHKKTIPELQFGQAQVKAGLVNMDQWDEGVRRTTRPAQLDYIEKKIEEVATGVRSKRLSRNDDPNVVGRPMYGIPQIRQVCQDIGEGCKVRHDDPITAKETAPVRSEAQVRPWI